MIRKTMTLVLIGTAMTIAGCNMVRGAGQDLQSAANCTEDAINGNRC